MSNAEAWLKSVKTKQLDVAKEYEAEWKWLNSSKAKQRSDAGKAHAFSEFKKRFPSANISRFIAQVDFDPNFKATGRVLFPDGDGSWENPLIEDRKYWSQGLRDALGFHQDGGFPAKLSLLIENKPQPVPAVDFSDNITQSIADVLNKEIKIYVTPTDYFTTKFRQIFTNTKITFRSAKYAKKWLGGPNMSFWPQQLNFAFWWATTGCGVSREILFSSGSSLNLTQQMRHAGSAVSKKLSFSYRGQTSGLTQNKMATKRESFSREQVIEKVSVESVKIEEHEGPEVSLEDVLEMSISNFTALRPSISNFCDFREEARRLMLDVYHRHEHGVHGMDRSLMSSLPAWPMIISEVLMWLNGIRRGMSANPKASNPDTNSHRGMPNLVIA